MKVHKLKEFIKETDIVTINSRITVSNYNATICFNPNFTNSLLYAKYLSVHDGFIVELHKGDVIGTLSLSKKTISAPKTSAPKNCQITDTRDYQRLQYQIQLITPQDNYYLFPKIDNLPFNQKFFYDDDITLCKSFESNQEISECFQKEAKHLSECLQKEVEHFVESKYSYLVTDDVFTGEKRIVWKNWYELYFDGAETYPYIILQNSKEQFVMKYHKKDFSAHKFDRGDRLLFLFEDNQCIDVQLRAKESNTDKINYKQISFSLLPQDIVSFSSKSLVRIRFEFYNGDESLDLKPKNETVTFSFKLYFQKYIKALGECGVNIENLSTINEPVKHHVNESNNESIDSSCFVYLMKDESNGFYKIGISNKPEYRERTLQSEKPTIVLLCAKKFPSRVIAEAIESALHKAYGYKRLRGEWFELDEKDIKEIKITLT